MTNILNAMIERIGSPAETRSTPARYAIALVLTAAAMIVTLSIQSLREETPFLLAFAAVSLASWRGGMGPGVLTGLLSLVTTNYFIHNSDDEFSLFTGPSALTAVLFLGVAAMISTLNEARLRAESQQAKLHERERAAEARYRAVFEGVADAILVVDSDRLIVDVNAAALSLLGITREEAIGKRGHDVVLPGPEWTEHEFARLQMDGQWSGEVFLTRKDGSIVPVEMMATVIDTHDGRINLAALRDVSERHLAQRQQQIFLESVSHDLKNPLASAKLHVQLLRRRLLTGEVDLERIISTLETVDRATLRMSAQLDELQDVARLRSGQQLELKRISTDLRVLVQEAVADAQSASTRHQIVLKGAENAITGDWDPVRVRRAIDNLLENAIKYSPDGGAITLDLATEVKNGGPTAVLTIRDHGVGIPASDLCHIFERYRRGSNVGRATSGAGIGLFGVRQIVEGHRGRIEVTSTEGAGSSFRLELPVNASL